MLDRVARLSGATCLLAQGTWLGRVASHHVNDSCRAIPANRGEINHKNMVVRGEFFRRYHLPMLSDQQNDSQSEEINVINKSQAENRPVPMQEAELKWKKSFLHWLLCLLCLAATQKITHTAQSLPWLGEFHDF